MKTYSEKLRDPRWQKMRLEILERDDWCCQMCFDEESTLNVHHRYYEAGHDPWDYPTRALVTLCESCHGGESDGWRGSEARLIRALRSAGAYNREINKLADILENKNLNELNWSDLIERVTEEVGADPKGTDI